MTSMQEQKVGTLVCRSHLQFISNTILANPHQSPLCQSDSLASINLAELYPDLSQSASPEEMLKTIRVRRTAELSLVCATCQEKPANLLHFDTFAVYCGESCFPEQRESGILLEGLTPSQAKFHIIHWFNILRADEHWELDSEQQAAYESSSANDSLPSFLSAIQCLITQCRQKFPEGEFHCSKCHCQKRREMFAVVARGPSAVCYYCTECAMMTSLKHVFNTAMYCRVQGQMCGSETNLPLIFTRKMSVEFHNSPNLDGSLLDATTNIKLFGKFTCSHSIRLHSILIGSISARHIMKGVQSITVNGKSVGYNFGSEPFSTSRVTIQMGLCIPKETTIAIEVDTTVQGDDDGLAYVPINYEAEVDTNRFSIGEDGSIWERNSSPNPVIGVLEFEYCCDMNRD